MTQPILDVAFHGDAAEIAGVATEAEVRGVGGLFVAEAAHDPYIALALAGQATSQIQIGSSVAIAFARTPMSTAYSAWDVHRLSGGRLILGLGTQIKPHITRRFDMPWSSPAPRMSEYVEALRAIFDSFQNGDEARLQGRLLQPHTPATALQPRARSTVVPRRSGSLRSARACSPRPAPWPTG